MRDYTAPILRVAALTQQNVQVVIVGDKSFPTLLSSTRPHIFVNSSPSCGNRSNQLFVGHFSRTHRTHRRRSYVEDPSGARQYADSGDCRHVAGHGAMVAHQSDRPDMGNVGTAAIATHHDGPCNTHAGCGAARPPTRHMPTRLMAHMQQGPLQHHKDSAMDIIFYQPLLWSLCAAHPIPARMRVRSAGGCMGKRLSGPEDPPELRFRPRHDAREAIRFPRAGRHRDAWYQASDASGPRPDTPAPLQLTGSATRTRPSPRSTA